MTKFQCCFSLSLTHTHTHTQKRMYVHARAHTHTQTHTHTDTHTHTHLLTYLLTYILHGAVSFLRSKPVLASQEIPPNLWKLMVHNHIHKSQSPVPILSQLDPVHTCTSHFLKIHLVVRAHAHAHTRTHTHIHTHTQWCTPHPEIPKVL